MTPEKLGEHVLESLKACLSNGTLSFDAALLPAVTKVERPKQREHGDWATNIAMQLAKPAKRNPRELAKAARSQMRW